MKPVDIQSSWKIVGNSKSAALIVCVAYVKSDMTMYNLLYLINLLPLSLDQRFLMDLVGPLRLFEEICEVKTIS